jgi:hypothetical protein
MVFGVAEITDLDSENSVDIQQQQQQWVEVKTSGVISSAPPIFLFTGFLSLDFDIDPNGILKSFNLYFDDKIVSTITD